MTYAPESLRDLAALWVANGGVNLGIVGDTRHTNTGTSYHLGEDKLSRTAYSRQTARDKAGLTNAASALDLGRLNGTLKGLQEFSKWLVAQARRNAPGTSDIREIIWSPDGETVLRWDRERGYNSLPMKSAYVNGRWTQGDTTHRTHTHTSWYRDSEKRDKTGVFQPYFEEEPMAQLPITDMTPKMLVIPVGAKALMLDGSDGKYTFNQEYTRYSPYGVGDARAYYATVNGKRVLRLVKGAAVSDVVSPATDEALKTALADANTALTTAGSRLAAIKDKVAKVAADIAND